MTKHVVRSIVAIIIVGMLGYVVWDYFIKPKSQEYIYNNSVSVVERFTDKNDGLLSKMSKLKSRNYLGENTSNNITITSNNVAYYGRVLLFGESMNAEYEDLKPESLYNQFIVESDRSDFNLFEISQDILEVFMYYHSYSAYAKKISAVQKNKFIGLKNDLLENINEMNLTIDKTLKYQKTYATPNTTQKNVLSDHYSNLVNLNYELINSLSKLSLFMQEFVIDAVYDNDFIFDFKNIIINAKIQTAQRIAKPLASSDSLVKFSVVENKVNLDVKKSFGFIHDYVALENAYNMNLNKNNWEFVSIVIDLNLNYKDILNSSDISIFNYNNTQKNAISYKTDLNLLNKININYRDKVVFVLKSLGY